jgi:hypothetical protein
MAVARMCSKLAHRDGLMGQLQTLSDIPAKTVRNGLEENESKAGPQV